MGNVVHFPLPGEARSTAGVLSPEEVACLGHNVEFVIEQHPTGEVTVDVYRDKVFMAAYAQVDLEGAIAQRLMLIDLAGKAFIALDLLMSGAL